jgi:putative serine protease PepD
MIATTSPAVRSARSVNVLEQDGDLVNATTVGTDPTSGISVLHIADDLPPARWDFSGPSTGSTAVAMAVDPTSRSDGLPTEEVYGGEVVATGMTLDLDPVSSTFAVVGVLAPLTVSDIGCPLIDTGGKVAGVLDRVGGTGLRSASTFLPAELVWGVADELISAGRVDPGSLGITTAATTDRVGALVASVAPGGPGAEMGLEDGDVVTAVDGYPVRSSAELDTRLYTDAPGTQVTLTVDRAGSTLNRLVDLADGDPDAPEDAASP